MKRFWSVRKRKKGFQDRSVRFIGESLLGLDPRYLQIPLNFMILFSRFNKFKRLNRCWKRMSETKCFHEMLLTKSYRWFTVSVTNFPYKFCHNHSNFKNSLTWGHDLTNHESFWSVSSPLFVSWIHFYLSLSTFLYLFSVTITPLLSIWSLQCPYFYSKIYHGLKYLVLKLRSAIKISINGKLFLARCLKWRSVDIYSQWIDVNELIDIPQFYLSIKSSLGEKRKQEKTTKIEKRIEDRNKAGLWITNIAFNIKY